MNLMKNSPAGNDNSPEPVVNRWPGRFVLPAIAVGAAFAWLGIDWAFHHPVQFCVGSLAYMAMGTVFAVVLVGDRRRESETLMDADQYAAARLTLRWGWFTDGLLWPLSVVAFIVTGLKMAGGR